MKVKVVLFCVFSLLAVNTIAVAQDTPWRVGVRLTGVTPNDDSSTIGDTGTMVLVDKDITLVLDAAYYFSEKLSLEVIAGTTKHDITTVHGALNGAGVGEVAVLPPTLTLQYHFTPDGIVDVYAGLGLNFTLFYDFDIHEDLAGLGVEDVDFESSFGLAANFGINIDLENSWFFNIDFKYAQIDTEAEIQLPGGGVLDTLDVDINPNVVGIGFAKRF